MGDFQHRDGSGSLFENDKGDNPNRPDMRGDIMIDGTLYKVSAWWKEGRRGQFLSLSVQPADQQGERREPDRQQQPPRRPTGKAALKGPPAEKPYGDEQQFKDDDIPF